MEKYTTQELEDMRDTHDCHLSPYDGCSFCEEYTIEIERRAEAEIDRQIKAEKESLLGEMLREQTELQRALRGSQ